MTRKTLNVSSSSSSSSSKKKVKFGPEELIEAPRAAGLSVCPDGRRFAAIQSSYSFQSHSKTISVIVRMLDSDDYRVIPAEDGVTDVTWLDRDHLLWLHVTENSNTSLVVTNADDPSKTYSAGCLPGPVKHLRLQRLTDDTVVIACAGQASPDGSLWNPKDKKPPKSTALIYDSTYIRCMDKYTTKEINQIFTATLKYHNSSYDAQGSSREHSNRYHLYNFTNALKGTRIECPIIDLGSIDNFNIDPYGLVIVAKDPNLQPGLHTTCKIYWIPKPDWSDLSPPELWDLVVPDFHGAITSPVISESGQIAFLQRQRDLFDGDRLQIIVTSSVHGASTAAEIVLEHAAPFWDRSPRILEWSLDGNSLYALAKNLGYDALFKIPVSSADVGIQRISGDFSVSDIAVLPHRADTVLARYTSFTNPFSYFLLNTSDSSLRPLKIQEKVDYGLNSSQVHSFHYSGDQGRRIHGWMLLPSNFDRSKKYPLAFFVHGGPQAAWQNAWNPGWNLAVFAEQGYVVVTPNFTGSTGYGQAFTDAIHKNWGGPYVDMERCFDWVEENLDFVDTDRSVAVGGSFGGYLMAWLQGHPLSKKFKTMVMHSGIVSMAAMLGSDDQTTIPADMGGELWTKVGREETDKWDPLNFIDRWNTPMLIIHAMKDYRVPLTHGLAAFNILNGRGIETRLLTFADDSHYVLGEENSLVWHLVVMNWCNKFVGLPKTVDRQGRTGEEFVMKGKMQDG